MGLVQGAWGGPKPKAESGSQEEAGSPGGLNSGVPCAGAGSSEAGHRPSLQHLPGEGMQLSHQVPAVSFLGLPPGPQDSSAADLAPSLPVQITFEISKQEDSQIPIWIILGSTLGGLLLLALLVLALWKVRSPKGWGWGAAAWLVGPGWGFQPLGSGASPHILLPRGAGTHPASSPKLTCYLSTLTTAGLLTRTTRGHSAYG